jgi:hypothetical protein
MKRKITLLFFAAVSVLKMNSQVVLTENFDSSNLPTANGWTILNNSVPTGGVADWFQGNPGAFPAFNGLANDYFAVNYQSVPTTGTGIGDISTWLFTPTVTITNGAVFQFATRAIGTATVKADRVQLRMSTGGGFTVPTGTASVGTFTTVLLDINPNLTTGTSSVVSNGTVNGYPTVWTVYTVAISGITGTVSGMFAFRSLIPNGGLNGVNSRYAGIDAVKYTLPCGPTAQSFTTCAGVSSTLTATGGLASTTYSWSNGSTGISTIVSPTATTVYSLIPSNGTVSCGNVQTATITVASGLSSQIITSSSVACAGTALTLSSIGSGTTFLWSTGGTGSSIVVSPTTTTTYTLGTVSGSCAGTSSIVITPLPTPTLNAAFTPTAICPSSTFVASGSGAAFYTWILSSTSSVAGQTVSLIAPSNTLGVTTQFTLSGQSAAGCVGQKVISIVIPPKPVVTAYNSRPDICVKDTVTWTASGATNYTWTPGGLGSTTNPRTYTAGANPTNINVTVVGEANGCRSSVTSVFTQSVIACATPTFVGLNNYNNEVTEASAFPNPFSNELKLKGTGGRVELFNAIGELILSTSFYNGETINTSQYSKGVYFLKVYASDGDVVKTIKLLKN